MPERSRSPKLTPGAATAPPLQLLEWKPLRRNSLLGFAKVRVRRLVIADVPVCHSNGRIWAGLPSKPMIDASGQVIRDHGGKVRYSPLLQWADKDAGAAFSAAVVAAVRRDYGPSAIEPEAGP